MSDDKAKTAQETLWDEVEAANFVKFEKFGDAVEGKLIAKDSSEQYGFGLYSVLNEDGEQKRFHGSSQLDDILLAIQLDTYIKVEYVDDQKTARGKMKLFKVLRKKD